MVLSLDRKQSLIFFIVIGVARTSGAEPRVNGGVSQRRRKNKKRFLSLGARCHSRGVREKVDSPYWAHYHHHYRHHHHRRHRNLHRHHYQHRHRRRVVVFVIVVVVVVIIIIFYSPDFKSCTTSSPVWNASFIVVAMTPTGPFRTHPLQ